MKRTVKAWAVRNQEGSLSKGTIRPTREGARAAWTHFGLYDLPAFHEVVRVTYTYDDGKPARRKGRAKR